MVRQTARAVYRSKHIVNHRSFQLLYNRLSSSLTQLSVNRPSQLSSPVTTQNRLVTVPPFSLANQFMFSSVYVPVRAYTIRPWTDPVQNAGWGCYRRPLTVISSGRSIGKPDMLDMLSVCLDIVVELVRLSWSDSDKAVGVVFRDHYLAVAEFINCLVVIESSYRVVTEQFGGVAINPDTELLEELGEQLLNCLTEPGAVTGF
ncbi:hypothetical protein F2Q68_00035652 [Brassica cretica]|uniref:Uncharacterized protein n=1 Tax=Brassica cretica TaxID=69181 RepID=A0A8S9H7L0_BRACR|nr:hypothetical protein F2Q68_00035652 [Brassica cretica]